jgi:hypothetical protein
MVNREKQRLTKDKQDLIATIEGLDNQLSAQQMDQQMQTKIIANVSKDYDQLKKQYQIQTNERDILGT